MPPNCAAGMARTECDRTLRWISSVTVCRVSGQEGVGRQANIEGSMNLINVIASVSIRLCLLVFADWTILAQYKTDELEQPYGTNCCCSKSTTNSNLC